MPNIGIIYVWYFATGLVAVPVWLWLGNRIGKHQRAGAGVRRRHRDQQRDLLLLNGAVTAFTLLFVAKGFCFGALDCGPPR